MNEPWIMSSIFFQIDLLFICLLVSVYLQQAIPKDWQGSHSHGKSRKVIVKFAVLASHGKPEKYQKVIEKKILLSFAYQNII